MHNIMMTLGQRDNLKDNLVHRRSCSTGPEQISRNDPSTSHRAYQVS